jgi:hypothetical protein
MEMKVGCEWSPVQTYLCDAELVAICRIQWDILKPRVFPVLSAKFNEPIEMQAWRLKSPRCESSMIQFNNETQGYSLASDLFDFAAR